MLLNISLSWWQKQIYVSVPPTAEFRDNVAFYAYLSTNESPNLPRHHTLIFGTVKTNIGLGYHKEDGIFIVPISGLYVFSWTVIAENNGWASVEIVVNANVLGTMFANDSGFSGDHNNWESGTGLIVVNVNDGDHVFIRMKENGRGIIHSDARGRTSFSGWKLQWYNEHV